MRYIFCVTTRQPASGSTPTREARDERPAGADDRVIDLTREPARDAGGVGTDVAPPAPAAAQTGRDPRTAMEAFGHAVARSAGYRGWLERQGVDPSRLTRFDQVPHLTKHDVFAGDVDAWIDGGVTAAAELVASSGHTGTFSVGVTSREELRRQQDATDAALRALGAGADRSTLLLNCLPMGIAVPSMLATVATPSVHLGMAQQLFERFHADFDLVVVVAEPVLLKELAERLFAANGASWTADRLACVVGGEWIAESWRRHVGDLLGLGPAQDRGAGGVLISLGAAELGLHLLFETPVLRAIRSALDTAGRARDLFGDDWGYTPTLFTYDPHRLHVEERRHDDGATTLAFTPLGHRLLPLVRYDLDDLGSLVPAAHVNATMAAIGAPHRVDHPVVAYWGRRSAGVRLNGRIVRPELVKQRLFAAAAEAAVLTGRFFLDDDPAHRGPRDPAAVLHVQLRPGTIATPGLASDLERFLGDVTGTDCRVEVHPDDAYPFHVPGDHQRKPTYHARR